MSRRSDDTNSSNSNASSSPPHRHSRPSPPHHHHHHHSPRFSKPGSSSTTSDQSVTDTSPILLALPPPPPSASMDDDAGTTPNSTTALLPYRPATATSRNPTVPVREDCWSEAATDTLVEAWGERFLELNRGNLRQKHWQEVADAVNNRHGHVRKARRTDVQCKNRIDTLKKKYKIEKSRVSGSKGKYTSQWPFFSRLDSLIGPSFKPSKPAKSVIAPHRKPQPLPPPPPPLRKLPPPPSLVPVAPRSKRPAVAMYPPPSPPSPPRNDDSFFRRNFSAIAAAAAAEEESEGSRSKSGYGEAYKDRAEDCRLLAQAIDNLGRMFERVERSKQRQLLELEKQRMQFAKDMEIQRMKLFMESQVQIERIKRAKRASEAGDTDLSNVISSLLFII